MLVKLLELSRKGPQRSGVMPINFPWLVPNVIFAVREYRAYLRPQEHDHIISFKSRPRVQGAKCQVITLTSEVHHNLSQSLNRKQSKVLF